METDTSIHLLERLRDIHLPAEPPLWPLAPGWWFLLLLLLLFLVLGVIGLYRGKALRRAALEELRHLRREYEHSGDARLVAAGVSMLLRRVALARAPRAQVAALCGEDWLRYLDVHGGTDQFSNGPGRQLITLPYQPEFGGDVNCLLDLAGRWVKKNS